MMFVSRVVFVVLLVEVIGCRVYNRTKRLVNGARTNDNEFPTVVGLAEKVSDGLYHQNCGGSIIHSKIALTAAHCVTKRKPYKIKKGMLVLYGSNNLKFSKKFKIRDIIVHHNFRFDGYCDIALVSIYGTFPTGIVPMSLATGTKPEDESHLKCHIVGWGLNKNQEVKLSDVIDNYITDISKRDKNNTILICTNDCVQEKVPVEVTNSSKCTLVKENIQNPDGNQLCTLGITGGACFGDSGGPVICSGVQYGIISYGICESLEEPFVSTRVSRFQNWIEYNMNYLLTEKSIVDSITDYIVGVIEYFLSTT